MTEVVSGDGGRLRVNALIAFKRNDPGVGSRTEEAAWPEGAGW